MRGLNGGTLKTTKTSCKQEKRRKKGVFASARACLFSSSFLSFFSCIFFLPTPRIRSCARACAGLGAEGRCAVRAWLGDGGSQQRRACICIYCCCTAYGYRALEHPASSSSSCCLCRTHVESCRAACAVTAHVTLPLRSARGTSAIRTYVCA